MANVATADEILNQRALERERFAAQQMSNVRRPALDGLQNMEKLSKSVAPELASSESKVSMPSSGISNVKPQNIWQARQEFGKQVPKLGDMLDDSAGRRKLPNGQEYLKKVAGPQHVAEAIALANKQYRMYFDGIQSELIGNVLALDVFVSPWVFLALYFLRVIFTIFPVKVKKISVIPPYSMGSAKDIFVLVGHTTAMLVIVIVVTLIFVIIAYIVWFLTLSFWEKIPVIWDVSKGALKVLHELLTSSGSSSSFGGEASGGTGATGSF